MNIGLLECDDVVGRFPQVKGGYREMFAALLPDAKFRYYEAHRGALPASATECDAWLCTGSKYSVYDREGWIDALAAFIRTIPDSNRRFVGICFGHQMLAHAMGGEVAKASQGWGAGVLNVELLKQEPWMQPPQKEIRIHHMHQDQVQKLPKDSVVLGRSAHCEVGMFRVGDSMLGIEGHPEFTAEFSEALIRARVERIGPAASRAALQTVRQPTDAPVVAQWIRKFIERKR
jgi:GMP synthase-like glutamine amidotransferase